MAQAAVASPLHCYYYARPSNPFILAHLSSLVTGEAPCPRHRFFSTFSLPANPNPRARGLRLPGSPASEDDRDEPSDSDGGFKKSRNELKREARRAVRWGMELASFSAPQIKRVLRVASLEREVFDALMLVKRLGPDVREGKRRQFSYIGRLLRSAQPELMDGLIQASKDGNTNRFNALSGQELCSTDDEEDEEETKHVEEEEVDYKASVDKRSDDSLEVAGRWLDGLICKDPLITNEVYSVQSVEFDRQELRKLVRRVQSIQDARMVEDSAAEDEASLNRARKSLLRFLLSLAKKASAEIKEVQLAS